MYLFITKHNITTKNNPKSLKENYNFNPFAGILAQEVNHTIVPRFPVSDIVALIEKEQSIGVEFIGKQGRGKTTHLVWLQQQLPHYPIFHLGNNNSIAEILQHDSAVVFVDSIHHLRFKERVQLFKAKRVVIYTTHYTRKLACILAKKKLQVIRFKGIDTNILKEIINNRLTLAQKDTQFKNTDFTEDMLQKLVKTYGDNYRGIINKLYENYQ